MKRILTIAAMSALLFTACEKNESVPAQGNTEVQFVVDQVVTRVATTGTVTKFETGDVIAITSSGLKEDITNEKYTYNTSGLSGKDVFFKSEGNATFVAHYPSSVDNAGDMITMTVDSDQSTDDKFHDNMFMVATAAGNKTNASVSLAFTHKLAMVKVNIEGLEKANEVKIWNIVPEITWSSTGLETSTTASAKEITAWKQADRQEYWALLPAQTLGQGTKFITITDTDDRTYEYVLGSEITFTTGKVKTVNLTFKGSLVNAEFPSLDNVNWSDEDTPIEDMFDEVQVSGITLDKEEAEMNVGGTVTLTATVTPENATDKTVVWTSSNQTVATVANGVVTALAAGQTTITATAGDFSATCTVTVSQLVENVPVESVALDQTAATVKVGKTLTLTATVTPENATDKTVVWTSSNQTVATVENGVVTALAAGETTITATAEGFTAECTVTVEALLELISADAGDFSMIEELNSTVTGWANAKTQGWALIQNGEGNVKFDTDLGEVQLKKSNDDWYRIGLVYYTGANVKAGTYTLAVSTRNIDATEDSTSDDIQVRVYDTQGNAQIGSTHTIATNKEVTIAKREITLSKDYPDGISFVFYPKTNDGFTYAIQNVTVIEKN